MLRKALPFVLFSIAVSLTVSLAVTMLRMGFIHVDPDRFLRRDHAGPAESSDSPDKVESPTAEPVTETEA